MHYAVGILLTAIIAYVSTHISALLPYHLVSASVLSLLFGMLLHPYVAKKKIFEKGVRFASKQLLRLSIVLMGLTLSFSQVLLVGSYSLFVMMFTLFTAFAGGFLLGKLLGLDWKLSSLISAGTGICGGSAIAAIAPTIDAKHNHVAYAISATFLFDVLMVLLFPLMGRYFSMTDMGYGLWTGTAVNDTSSVVAAGYAFSDSAGSYSVIVKLTRTLAIIPTVLIFSFINARVESKNSKSSSERKRVALKQIFPFFIILFLVMIAVKSLHIVSDEMSTQIASYSKFCMVMALGAIGLKTNFKEVCSAGFKPMFHGFIISATVVVVSFFVQLLLGQV